MTIETPGYLYVQSYTKYVLGRDFKWEDSEGHLFLDSMLY